MFSVPIDMKGNVEMIQCTFVYLSLSCILLLTVIITVFLLIMCPLQHVIRMNLPEWSLSSWQKGSTIRRCLSCHTWVSDCNVMHCF